MTENWSTRRRARYFHAPPARSHGAFWVGDTAAAGKSRHPICSGSSLKEYSNSPPKSNRRHSGTPSVRHQPRRNLVTAHVQHVQKQTVLSSDVRTHEEIKRHSLPKLCPTSERSGRNRRGLCQTFTNSASNFERGLDCVLRSSRQADGLSQSIVTRMTKVHVEL